MTSIWLDDFRQTIDQAGGRLQQISEEHAATPAAEGKWSPKQIVGHLIDSAANNHQRFVLAQFSDDLVFQGYDQEAWVEVQHYNDEPWSNLVQLWRQYNLHLCHVMSAIPPETSTKPRVRHSLDTIAWNTVNASEPATLEYFMRDYVAHLENHLKQIYATL